MKHFPAALSLGALLLAGPAHAENWVATNWPELDMYGQPFCEILGRVQSPSFKITATPTHSFLELRAYALANLSGGETVTLRFSDASVLRLGAIEKTDRHWGHVVMSHAEAEHLLTGMTSGDEVTVEAGADSMTIPTTQSPRAVAGFRGCVEALAGMYDAAPIPD